MTKKYLEDKNLYMKEDLEGLFNMSIIKKIVYEKLKEDDERSEKEKIEKEKIEKEKVESLGVKEVENRKEASKLFKRLDH